MSLVGFVLFFGVFFLRGNLPARALPKNLVAVKLTVPSAFILMH